jgi:hypothetical protein
MSYRSPRTATAAVVLSLVACGLFAACAPLPPEARAGLADRAHTPEERADYNDRVRAYQALRAN